MIKRLYPFAFTPVLLLVGIATAQSPMMEMVANKVIQKYQQATCEQLWQQKSAPKSAQEQEMIQLLRSDAQVRNQFLNIIAGPVANKMFDCGMIP